LKIFFPHLAVLALSLVVSPACAQEPVRKAWSEAELREMIREELMATLKYTIKDAVKEALAEVKTKPAAPKLTYDDAKAAAIRDGKPLLAFVRMAVVDVPGCVCVDVPGGFADDKGESYVMLGKPDGNGDINRAGFFHHAPTIEAVRAMLTVPKNTKPAGAVCSGGCGAACTCNGTKGGRCTCAPQHQIYRSRAEAPTPMPTYFTAAACASGH
jgi:hypothetical protein